MDQGSGEAPTGGLLPVGGSAGVDGGPSPVAELELELPEMESMPLRTPPAYSSSSSSSYLRRAVQMDSAPKGLVSMEMTPLS